MGLDSEAGIDHHKYENRKYEIGRPSLTAQSRRSVQRASVSRQSLVADPNGSPQTASVKRGSVSRGARYSINTYDD